MGKADAVVCGAGIAGVATAYFLAVEMGVGGVVLCDPRPPLTLTSDKSTECYRNWWPNAPMVGLMNRSIDLLDRLAAGSGDAFRLNRRGYLYVTGDRVRAGRLEAAARRVADLGAGPLRVHRDQPAAYRPDDPGVGGADLITDPGAVKSHFPYLTGRTAAVLHARRAGWFSAQQFGSLLLDRARAAGLEVVPHGVERIEVHRGRVRSVRLDDGRTIDTLVFVDAAGPHLGRVAALLGERLPVFSELHLKVTYRETHGFVPSDAPLLIWSDPQRIDWSEEESAGLASDPTRSYLLGELPAACHGRPEGPPGSPYLLALWEHRRLVMEPEWPVPIDPLYAEVVMRGMATMVPGLEHYRERMPHATVDGGYYTKTEENLPLIGPLTTRGAFVVGALSGFGVMAAAAAGELCAQHIGGGSLPSYAGAFLPSRFADPAYRPVVEGGQL